MPKKINVLLVDDHAVVRAGYKTYLLLNDRIGEVFEADRGEVACQVYQQHATDVVVMDLSMPGMSGFESIHRLVQRDHACKVLVFSNHYELAYVTRAIKAGAKGYISKTSAPSTLVAAVCQVAEGGAFIEPEIAQRLALSMVLELDEAAKIKSLSAREFDIFCLLANGLSCKEAADRLCISSKSVSNYATAIKDKLGVKTWSELTLAATRQGIIKV